MNYGIITFNSNRPTILKFSKATDIKSFALIFLKRKLKEEGLKFNVSGLTEYLNSWLEWSEETEEPVKEFSQIIDTASDTLTYSNVHLQKRDLNNSTTWIPLTSEDKKEFCKVICDKLDSIPEKV